MNNEKFVSSDRKQMYEINVLTEHSTNLTEL
jgi:hypothetical protein